MNIRTATSPITAVLIHPRTTIGRLAVNGPITDLLQTMRIITAKSGTATTPFMTALQNKAFLGLIGKHRFATAV
jgi:hypothetical protein